MQPPAFDVINDDMIENRIRELLDYDPETGVFVWKTKRRGKGTIGKPVGFVHPNGYLRICVDYRLYMAHHLAWLFIHGELPTKQIDHIDGDRLNNRASNLRLCNHAQNAGNRKVHRNSKTGVKGVSLIRSTGRFGAWIKVDGKSINLGSFQTIEEAGAAYRRKAEEAYGAFASHLNRGE